MTEFWDKPAEKSGKVLAAFLEGLPLVWSAVRRHVVDQGRRHGPSIMYTITPCWVTLLQPARRAAVLGQPSASLGRANTNDSKKASLLLPSSVTYTCTLTPLDAHDATR